MHYVIKKASDNDIHTMIGWAKAEGWNPGVHDHITFPSADPDGFFMGYLDDKPIASISAVQYSDSFGFIGLYIVDPKYRGKGYGIEIWEHGMNYLRSVSCIGLDGVIEQQGNYERSGFAIAHRNVRYSGKAPDIKQEIHLTPLASVPITAILAFETTCFPCDRHHFLTTWIKHAHAGFAVIENNCITGYGVMRKCHEGFKIGPLFANDEKIAEAIFLGLCEKVNGQSVSIDLPVTNIKAIELVSKYDFAPAFETARMYTKTAPKLETDRIFGITTFELG